MMNKSSICLYTQHLQSAFLCKLILKLSWSEHTCQAIVILTLFYSWCSRSSGEVMGGHLETFSLLFSNTAYTHLLQRNLKKLLICVYSRINWTGWCHLLWTAVQQQDEGIRAEFNCFSVWLLLLVVRGWLRGDHLRLHCGGGCHTSTCKRQAGQGGWGVTSRQRTLIDEPQFFMHMHL